MQNNMVSIDITKPTKESTVYAEEASSLGWGVGKYPKGFLLYGAYFQYVKTEYDADGDVIYWLYFANSIQRHAKVFND